MISKQLITNTLCFLFYILPTASFLLFLTKTPYQSKGKGFEVVIREIVFPPNHSKHNSSSRIRTAQSEVKFGQNSILHLSIYSSASQSTQSTASKVLVPSPSITVQSPVQVPLEIDVIWTMKTIFSFLSFFFWNTPTHLFLPQVIFFFQQIVFLNYLKASSDLNILWAWSQDFRGKVVFA